MTDLERAQWLRVALHFVGRPRRVRHEAARFIAEQGDAYCWGLFDHLVADRDVHTTPRRELH